MSTIDILLPTLRRPERLMQFVQSVIETAKDRDCIRFYVYIDEGEYSASINNYTQELVKVHIGQKQILSNYYNELLKISKGDIVFLGADDLIFETPNWDIKVNQYFDSLADKIGLFYGEDGHNFKNATHPFVSRKSCEILGYFTPPYFEADFNDLWLHELYQSLGRLHHDKEIMIRHNHKNANPIYNDETYALSEPKRARAAKVWEETKHLIQADKRKLTDKMIEHALL